MLVNKGDEFATVDLVCGTDLTVGWINELSDGNECGTDVDKTKVRLC